MKTTLKSASLVTMIVLTARSAHTTSLFLEKVRLAYTLKGKRTQNKSIERDNSVFKMKDDRVMLLWDN